MLHSTVIKCLPHLFGVEHHIGGNLTRLLERLVLGIVGIRVHGTIVWYILRCHALFQTRK